MMVLCLNIYIFSTCLILFIITVMVLCYINRYITVMNIPKCVNIFTTNNNLFYVFLFDIIMSANRCTPYA